MEFKRFPLPFKSCRILLAILRANPYNEVILSKQ